MQVVTAQQSAARDAAAIDAGTPSFALMSRAGERAVDALIRHAGTPSASGVAVFAGTGNNGGDAWVVARLLRERGISVTVHTTGDPRTPGATRAKIEAGSFESPRGDELVVIDGLLGTGSQGEPRGEVATAMARLAEYRARGAFVLALDLPSGLDATTGSAANGTVAADVTVVFGSMKRGLLINRSLSGAIELVDIGLGAHAVMDDGAPFLLDAAATHNAIPPITASAHKGTRGRVAIVGGSEGMAGAVTLAARGALRSGAGLVRVVVAPESLSAVQGAVAEATATTWEQGSGNGERGVESCDAIAIGPGLGRGHQDLVESILRATDAPVVIDADGLNTFAENIAGLRASLGVRQAVLTPHPAECARLMNTSTDDVLKRRFEIGLELARATNAVVVLKGTPTVISAPDGRVIVAPVGSPVLATGGSGDVLAGVCVVMLAAFKDAMSAACAAVWAHGRAAELVGTASVRGKVLADVVDSLSDVWRMENDSRPEGILYSLPMVGER